MEENVPRRNRSASASPLPTLLAIILGVAALVAGAAAFFFQNQSAVLQKKYDRLSEDHRVVQADHERLRERLGGLESQLKNLDTEISKTRKDLTETQTKAEKIAEEKERVLREKLEIDTAYSRLQDDLKKQIANKDVSVSESGGNVTIKLTDRILFESGKLDLKPAAEEVLAKISLVMQKFPDRVARIEGHTDSVPVSGRLAEAYPSNWELSTARACTAVRYLIEKGVSSSRLEAMGLADSRPVAANDSEGNKALNRRIEIVLVPGYAGMPQMPAAAAASPVSAEPAPAAAPGVWVPVPDTVTPAAEAVPRAPDKVKEPQPPKPKPSAPRKKTTSKPAP
ncbi:MAG: OmpA family protein [Verrucomicrobiae bacterium]|nr:OmpA family protein [Verrucomicrobiae bacterium]